MESLNRRQFFGTAVAGAAAMSGVLRAADSQAALLKLGLIGCGWYGMVDVEAAFKAGGVEVVALCDVDSDHLSQSADKVEKRQGKRPITFKDYRELLAVPGLQAVIIATPPHWHALQFIAALEKGLDIYCEKPLAYDVRECQAMLAAARRHPKSIVQIGFQRRQSPAFQQVADFLKQGAFGRVVQADVQIHYNAGMKDATPQDPPASLDWDLWCGPGPKLPYSPQIGHMSWRLEKATGHGHLVDWGIHLIDATRMILGEALPFRVSACGANAHLKTITTPDTLTAQFDFATCPVTWRHRLWGAEEFTPEVSNGIFIFCEKGTIFATDDRWIEIPKGKNQQRTNHEAKADLGGLHVAEFLDSVRSRKQPSGSVEQAFQSTVTVKLGMIAYDCGQSIRWNPQANQIEGNLAAAALLKREYRKPYVHPFVG
ncbi:MAG: Gfo/Idh/MocA family oxidoreductase [Phycisphaerae bacterium]|nr:Gfo/Idh/MocA family oxidoreductase [Phycisphaerae bacterium]